MEKEYDKYKLGYHLGGRKDVFNERHVYELKDKTENLDFLLKGEQISRRNELLRLVGLKAGIRIGTLSRGMRQRLGIAAALVNDPEILLLDEPTSALDPEMVGEVLSVMRDLIKDGITMAVVTHEIGFACEIADRMIFMDKGKIRMQGTPDEVVHHSNDSRITEFFTRLANKKD